MSLDNPHRPIRVVKASERLAAKDSFVQKQNYGIIVIDEQRVLWLAVLHGLTIFSTALRKYLKVEKRCTHCGNDL